jgi:hypothetical protein
MQHMPLLGERLLTSDFDARCNDAEWRAGVTLWWRAWQQVPAGSLPNDDAALAGLAGYRRDPRGWAKVRANALHGFVLCSDGRLYHPVICELAQTAWKKRETWRRLKAGQRKGQGEGQTQDVHPSVQVDTPVDNKRPRPVKGEGEGFSTSEANASSVEAAPAAPPAKRKTALPAGFEVPIDWIAWAIEDEGKPAAWVYDQRKRFVDYWRGTGKPMADWQAVWRNWIRRAEEFNGQQHRAPSKADAFTAAVAGALEHAHGHGPVGEAGEP